jgi:hypothetical protein
MVGSGEAEHVLADIRGRFLERDEHARLSRCDAGSEKLDGKDRLPAARGAGDQRCTIAGQPALRDDIEA